MTLPCPCCRCLTLPSHGTYDICPVCFWEDDFTVDPDDDLNPNNLTLREARLNLATWGAVEPHLVHWTRPPQPGEAPPGTPGLGDRPYDRWPIVAELPGGLRFGWIGPPAPARWVRREAFVVLPGDRRVGLGVQAGAPPGTPPSVVRGISVGRGRAGQFELHLAGETVTYRDVTTALTEGIAQVLLTAVPAQDGAWEPIRIPVGWSSASGGGGGGGIDREASPDEPAQVAGWAQGRLREIAPDAEIAVLGPWSWVARRTTEAGLTARGVAVHDVSAVPSGVPPGPLPLGTRCLLEWSSIAVPARAPVAPPPRRR